MKVLILSVTAGGGHNSTACAMETYFKSRGIECEVFDTFGHINKQLSKNVAETYLWAIKRAKLAYGKLYRFAEMRRANADEQSFTRDMGFVLSKKIRELIVSYKPDVIIYTHVYAGVILDNIKNTYGFDAKTIGIVTDFVFHPYWEEVYHLDYVVTANEKLTYQGMKKGFTPEQIKPLGIPVSPKFAISQPKSEAKRKLGLDPEKKTLLLMGGSMGYGDMAKTVASIDRLYIDFQMIVVCGNNKSAYSKIKRMRTQRKIRVFGFTDKVPEIMDATDLIITKPGGLSTSEALAKGLPMIIVDPIPGQEDRNAEFLTNSGVAVAVSPTYPLEEAVWSLITDDRRLANMRSAISLIRHPNSTRDICDFAISIYENKKTNK